MLQDQAGGHVCKPRQGWLPDIFYGPAATEVRGLKVNREFVVERGDSGLETKVCILF
ncbi:hypothetical protein K443DRAFT_680294 [Laccaria amethystina LaAM-08-1]|uniref:Uncharacterized protein n=1 Tax=Laccaria amethystina LaAM-08-1 TaxID=1095629 RepID=A0A0C9XNA9_9AGAR|nr:hypothetical protein K443DRAFT_680294 [Laccaria amethystina LaAM-08-1]